MEFKQPIRKEDWDKLDKETLKNRGWVFDIEADGLLKTISEVWVLVATDVETLDTFVFSDYDSRYPNLMEFTKLFDSATFLVGHFICSYDLPALEKVKKWVRKPTTKPVDTLIMSKVLDYERFGSGFKHSLQDWGEFFKHPKVQHEDWSQYSEEMLHRCIEDVRINVKVFKYLSKQLNENPKADRLRKGLKAEHGTSEFVGRSHLKGWPMNKELMLKTYNILTENLTKIEDEINPLLKPIVKLEDKEPKVPVFIKSGDFNAHTARWFRVTQDEGNRPRPVVKGEFTRIHLVNPEIGNIDSVKSFLREHGWEPDDWNYKKLPDGSKIKTSEKLTETSLALVDHWGPMIDEYFTTRARHSILSGWIENLDKDNYLVGDMFVIGTPTGRAVHELIANIPDSEQKYGEEFRSIFSTIPGWKVVGADSKSCQIRALCHYLDNPEYTKIVLHGDGSGDMHQFHANIAKEVYEDVDRKKMKRTFFAMIFGAGGYKLGMYITGRPDFKVGQAVKEILISRIGGFRKLLEKIEIIYKRNYDKGTKKSWLPCIDGRKIYIESPHKGLNYIVQSCEAVTCKMAVALATERLDKEIGRDNWVPLIFMHDELQVLAKEEYAEQAAKICANAFKDGPLEFGITIMDGDSKIGNNWCETH
jgi:DNA polymerase I